MKVIGGNLNTEYAYQLSITFIKGKGTYFLRTKKTWAIPLFVACKNRVFCFGVYRVVWFLLGIVNTGV